MEINRAYLLQVLTAVQPGLAAKELIQQSNTFVFKDDTVVTFNDEIAVHHPLEDIDFEGAVQAEELLKLLKRLSGDTVELTADGGELKVKCGRSRSGIRLEEEIALPLDAIEWPEEFWQLPEAFLPSLGRCLFTVSNDMSKPVLTCVHLEGAIIQSCDNYRLTRCTLDEDFFDEPRLLPGVAGQKLIGYKPIEFGVTEGWLHFRNEQGVVFSCRAYQDDFPNVSGLLDVEGESVTMPAELEGILDRAEVFSKAEFTQDERVSVLLQPKRLTVKSQGISGWFEESSPLKYRGEEIEFQVHPGFFKDVIKILDEVTIAEGRIKLNGEGFEHVVITYI